MNFIEVTEERKAPEYTLAHRVVNLNLLESTREAADGTMILRMVSGDEVATTLSKRAFIDTVARHMMERI